MVPEKLLTKEELNLFFTEWHIPLVGNRAFYAEQAEDAFLLQLKTIGPAFTKFIELLSNGFCKNRNSFMKLEINFDSCEDLENCYANFYAGYHKNSIKN